MRLWLLKILALLLILVVLVACSQDGADDQVAETRSGATAVATSEEMVDNEEPATEPTDPAATATQEPTPGPTETPTRPPTGPLTVCMNQEPDSLFLYGPDSYAARMVRELIFDGPIDTRDYDFQPVILEKIPSLTDGDARLETVAVEEGQLVVDVSGNVVSLRDGVRVRPAGCYGDECSVTFASEGGEAAQPGAEEDETSDSEEVSAPAALEMERLVVEFSLLEGISWSDGEPLTADDSVFSFQIALEAEIPPRQRTGQQGVTPARRIDPVERTETYEALDDRTVRWTGLPGFMDAYYQGNFFAPLPEHQLGSFSPQELQDSEPAARLPMGWGPYILNEWVEGEQITAVRNENYFGADEETPYFDEVVIRFGGEEGFALPDVLADGTCDVVTSDALGLAWSDYGAWAAEGAVQFLNTPGTVWEHVVFGINPSSQVTWRGDIFEDRRVRQAAALCIDRQTIMAEIMGGLSAVPDTFVPPDHPLYASTNLSEYAYDPAAGAALLQEAGWRDTNGDGLLESYGIEGLADGSTLAFTYTTTTSTIRQRVAEMVAASLAQCGMRVTVAPEALSPQAFFAADINSPVFGRAFDITGFAWFADMLPPCHLYLSSETPTEATGWSGFNVSGFSNESYDAACRRARSAVPGMSSYEESHQEAMRIFNDELPAVPLFVHLKGALARNDIEGLMLNATQTADIWNVENMRRRE